jgi:hypothetical protein
MLGAGRYQLLDFPVPGMRNSGMIGCLVTAVMLVAAFDGQVMFCRVVSRIVLVIGT